MGGIESDGKHVVQPFVFESVDFHSRRPRHFHYRTIALAVAKNMEIVTWKSGNVGDRRGKHLSLLVKSEQLLGGFFVCLCIISRVCLSVVC